MKFWDSSAIVPLLTAQAATRRMQAIAATDQEMLTWWGSSVECASAIARLERERILDQPGARTAFERLQRIGSGWLEIEPSDSIRTTAIRFLRVHPLRAGDAFQLAAAFAASGGQPSTIEIVTLDERLSQAALKEGFSLQD